MSYNSVVKLIKRNAELVNPTGIFIHSDKWKASLNFDENDKQIYLYPFTGSIDLNNHYFESWNIVMGFYFQDLPDATPEQQQAIIKQADIMSRFFLSNINETEGVELSNVKKEPSYRQMSGTYTGYLISFTLGATSELCVLVSDNFEVIEDENENEINI